MDVESDHPQREIEALAARDQNHGDRADDRPEIRQEAGESGEQREHEGDRHAENEEADIGEGPDRRHGDALADQPAAQAVAGLVHHLEDGGAPLGRRQPRDDVDIGVGVGGEIDAEEKNDQTSAEQSDDRERDRGRAGGDTPRAQEFAEDLDEVDVLEDRGLIGEARELLGEAGRAYGEAARELGDLLGESRPRSGEHEQEEDRRRQHHHGKHQEPRQLGELGERLARAVEHDGEQDAGEGEQDGSPRIPQADGGSDDGDHRCGNLGDPRGVARAAPPRLARNWRFWVRQGGARLASAVSLAFALKGARM
jgi:hypothetical protein